MAVPYTFGSATTSIPLSQLDSNFATTITLGNTAIQLGNTVTTLNNMTLGNVTVSSGNVVAGIASGTITQAMLGTNVAGNGPAFSAYQSSAQTLTSNTYTKINLQTEEFDTNNNFDSTTNYRFTPTVAGYYQVNAEVYPNTTTTLNITLIYKNGAQYKAVQNTAANVGAFCSCLVYLNGSTDYIELYGYFTGVTPQLFASSTYTFLQASMVRAA